MATQRAAAGRTSGLQWLVLVALLSSAVASQVSTDGRFVQRVSPPDVSWIRSPDVMRRATLGFNALGADIYWIRTIQFFGDTLRSRDPNKNYDRLNSLLDITTGLDPHFNIAYRLGAILLSEPYPRGAGRPDQAIALLEKGMRAMPDKWQYPHDAGMVAYWWNRDYTSAAHWFLKAEALPGAPKWLGQVAASFLAEGGARDSARGLWAEMAANAEHEWLRQAARRGLMQLDAEAVIESLQQAVNKFSDENGRFPSSWSDLIGSRRIQGTPLDPSGEPYALDPVSGEVDVARESPLYPLPGRRPRP
ncbi:MAG TPA: hypothetical protein VKB50_33155 [Vicinamibacterales bacterium]|nr:hypothetical protein [Vicinamibacterales bacterium]